MIRFLFNIIPTFIFYVDKKITKGFPSINLGFLVFIENRHRDNDDVLESELQRAKYNLLTLFVHNALYYTSDNFRVRFYLNYYAGKIMQQPRPRHVQLARMYATEIFDILKDKTSITEQKIHIELLAKLGIPHFDNKEPLQ